MIDLLRGIMWLAVHVIPYRRGVWTVREANRASLLKPGTRRGREKDAESEEEMREQLECFSVHEGIVILGIMN